MIEFPAKKAILLLNCLLTSRDNPQFSSSTYRSIENQVELQLKEMIVNCQFEPLMELVGLLSTATLWLEFQQERGEENRGTIGTGGKDSVVRGRENSFGRSVDPFRSAIFAAVVHSIARTVGPRVFERVAEELVSPIGRFEHLRSAREKLRSTNPLEESLQWKSIDPSGFTLAQHREETCEQEILSRTALPPEASLGKDAISLSLQASRFRSQSSSTVPTTFFEQCIVTCASTVVARGTDSLGILDD